MRFGGAGRKIGLDRRYGGIVIQTMDGRWTW
jgi:hypothetical protein